MDISVWMFLIEEEGMEKRNSWQWRGAGQVGKDVVSLGGLSNPKPLECHHPRLHPRAFLQGRSFAAVDGAADLDDGYGGGYRSPRTPSDDGGETALLLPKIADNSGSSRNPPPSPSPMRSPVSSFPFSPPSEMCYSQGASDFCSPSNLQVAVLYPLPPTPLCASWMIRRGLWMRKGFFLVLECRKYCSSIRESDLCSRRGRGIVLALLPPTFYLARRSGSF